MDLFSEIKARLDLREMLPRYVEVTKKNGVPYMNCLWHKDGNPSLRINKDFVYCYSCSKYADTIDCMAKLTKQSLSDTRTQLMIEAKIPNTSSPFRKDPREQYKTQLINTMFSDEGKDYLHYLKERGFTEDYIKHAGLGVIPDIPGWTGFIKKYLKSGHRLAIPLYSNTGYLLGYRYRSLKNAKPKYLSTPGLSPHLSHYKPLCDKIPGSCILVEGELDALILANLGYSGVSLGGCHVKDEHIATLSKQYKRFYLCLDNDQRPKQLSLLRKHIANPALYALNISEPYKDINEWYIAQGELPIIKALRHSDSELTKIKQYLFHNLANFA